MLLSEIPPQIDVSAFVDLGVMCDWSKVALTLVAKTFFMLATRSGRQLQGLDGTTMMTRALRIALNETGLIQRQHLANPFTAFCPSRRHKKLADAALARDLDVGAASSGRSARADFAWVSGLYLGDRVGGCDRSIAGRMLALA
jgi:hypothetical protein